MNVWLEQILVLAVSFIANTFSALAGGGAGLLQFPILIFLGLPFAVALATHKVASVALGIGATLRYAREDMVERNFLIFMLLAGLPAVIAGALLIIRLPETLSESLLGLMTIGMGIYSIFQKNMGQHYQPCHRDLKGLLLGGAGLFLIGLLNGSLTSGTGLLATMLLIKWFGMDYKRAIAYTMIAVGLFWNGSGGLTLAIVSEIKWEWLPALLLGSLLGGYTGAHFALLKGNRFIKRCFEIVTILTGLKLLL